MLQRRVVACDVNRNIVKLQKIKTTGKHEAAGESRNHRPAKRTKAEHAQAKRTEATRSAAASSSQKLNQGPLGPPPGNPRSMRLPRGKAGTHAWCRSRWRHPILSITLTLKKEPKVRQLDHVEKVSKEFSKARVESKHQNMRMEKHEGGP